MAIIRVKNRNGYWKEVNSKDFDGKPFGYFTNFIRKNYDILYGIDNKEDFHTIQLEVFGEKKEIFKGYVTVCVQTEDQIHDEILDSDIQWDNFSYDESDIEWDGDWSIESIDKGATIMKRDSFGNAYFSENIRNPNQLSFKF